MPRSTSLNCSEWFLRGKHFCYCIPVRAGVIIFSILGMLIPGALSIALWLQVANARADYLSGSEKAVFVLAALVETLLFVVSIIGFLGAVVPKQLFTHIYAWALYIHFLINIGVAIFLFVMVAKFSERAKLNLCMAAIQSTDAEDQCNSLIRFFSWVVVVVQLVVLLIELEACIVVTRYLNLLKEQKYQARQTRLGLAATPRSTSFPLQSSRSERYSFVSPSDNDRDSLIASHSRGLSSHTAYPSEHTGDFNPYAGLPPSAHTDMPVSRSSSAAAAADADGGYGGGSWTYNDISTEEKSRLQGELPDTAGAGGSAKYDAQLSESPVTQRDPSVESHPPSYSPHDPWSR